MRESFDCKGDFRRRMQVNPVVPGKRRRFRIITWDGVNYCTIDKNIKTTVHIKLRQMIFDSWMKPLMACMAQSNYAISTDKPLNCMVELTNVITRSDG
jgi:hypothetical protein